MRLLPTVAVCLQGFGKVIPGSICRAALTLAVCIGVGAEVARTQAADELEVSFSEKVVPVLDYYCYDCHGFGESKGGLALDELGKELRVGDHELWEKVLKRVRFGLMPPHGEERIASAELQTLVEWIKKDAFSIDPGRLDPGATVLRRLNRVEYRNSVAELIGVDVDTQSVFPADDSGEGFDNIGSVLTISPMLLEKYLDVAQEIVERSLQSIDAKENKGSYLHRYEALGDVFGGTSEAGEQRQVLWNFVEYMATAVYRRPVGELALDRLTDLGLSVAAAEGKTLRDGAAQALVAMLASPRFIFRMEDFERADGDEGYPLLDEWSLASRMSYFLWSTTPDRELFDLAESGRLRENLDTQIDRMLEDPRSQEFVRNFAGQWLHARDVEAVAVNDFDLFLRENPNVEVISARRDLHRLASTPARNRSEEETRRFEEAAKIATEAFAQPRPKFSKAIRSAMRQETELQFEYILRESRNALELIDCGYAFLNEDLATHYGIEGVVGKEMRRVDLPAGHPRGGVLTQGTILAVTSNPTRTSPVKRGVFILENLLATPPSPPPPNITALEDVATAEELSKMSLRETLALHREKPLCSSCHDQMDPLGLALENFNAMGQWRDEELGQGIESHGKLISGESFQTIQQLKEILRTKHSYEFYYCLTEKLLTYALGREVEYYDTETVDRLVQALEQQGGNLRALIRETIYSVPFQRGRDRVSSAHASNESGTLER